MWIVDLLLECRIVWYLKYELRVFRKSIHHFSSIKENKYSSRGHSSSKLTSRHDSWKQGVLDGRVTKKPGGLGYMCRRRSSERKTKESRMLTPSYIYEGKPQLYVAAVKETEHEVPKDTAKDKSQSVAAPTPAPARLEKYNELSPLMTTMVEDELKNIMIKIWQTLPDVAPSDADKLVLDKLKDTAGDDLRNAIGLNVTKRLLNVHNGILVKILIYSPVTPSDTYAFSKKYHIVDFKHVQRRTYAGRLRTWTDFDELYTHNNLRCGPSDVKITPIYNFLKCPPKLRTIFDGQQDYSDAKKIEKEAAKKMKKPEGKTIVTADKVLAEEAKKEIAKKDNKIAKVSDNKRDKEQVHDNQNSKDTVSDTKHSNKVEVRADSKNTQSANKGTTAAENIAAAKNTSEKPLDKSTVNKQSEPSNIARKEMTTSKPIETKSETKMDTTKMVDIKKENASQDQKEISTETQATKVVPAKTAANKPPAINTPRVATNTPKATTITPKAETNTSKAAINNPKAATNAPKVATNTPKVVTNTLKAATDNFKALTNTSKDATNTPKVATTPKKELVAAKPNEKKPDVKSTKVEPTKAPVEEPTKPIAKKPVANSLIANTPTTTNSDKKETAPQPVQVKKPEMKVAKVDYKAKEPTKKIKEAKNTQAAIKKLDTKITKVIPKSANKSLKDLVKITRSTKKVDAKPKKNESDFDELNDRDILALLSGGIVLDECSGSDVD